MLSLAITKCHRQKSIFISFIGDLANSLEHVKNLLLMKMDPNASQTQSELTAEVDRTVQKCLGKNFTKDL